MTFLLWLLVAGTAPPSATSYEKAWEACRNESGTRPLVPDELRGCEAVIASPEAPKDIRAIAHANRGMIMSRMSFFATAKDEFARAIELDPTLVGAYYNRAVLNTDLNDLTAATADLDMAIKLDPSFEPAYLQRGVVKARDKKFAAAVTDFEQAVRLDPKDALALLNQGHAKLALGDESGNADIAKAKAMDPALDQ